MCKKFISMFVGVLIGMITAFPSFASTYYGFASPDYGFGYPGNGFASGEIINQSAGTHIFASPAPVQFLYKFDYSDGDSIVVTDRDRSWRSTPQRYFVSTGNEKYNHGYPLAYWIYRRNFIPPEMATGSAAPPALH